MNRVLRLAAVLGALVLSSLGVAASASESRVPLVLISLDGFRWDYCTLYADETPHLRSLIRHGISARGLIPVFPSNTFPNHYSIATGMYPSRHGIVNNRMSDAETGETFLSNQRTCVQDSRWWGGEPIWVTAAKQGRQSGCLFWIGSEAAIDGFRPTHWRPFDPQMPFEARLADLLAWLELPAGERPDVITFYIEEANSAGHHFGPDAPELAATIRQIDDQLARLQREIERRGIAANYVIVSDHGMTDCGPDRVIALDDFLDLSTVQIDFDQTTVGLRPRRGTSIDAVMDALAKLPAAAKAYRASDLPAHLKVDPRQPRVPPIWILPDEGWQVMPRSSFEKARPKFPRGQHGYDPMLESMHGILIACGPAFKVTGEVVDRVENVHVYNLLCAALGLAPSPNDGDDRLVRAMLR